MSFLKKIASALSRGEAEADVFRFYVQCDKCGEKLAIRIDKKRDIQRDYDQGGYFLRKEVMDSRCYQLMHAEFRFDGNYKLLSQDISGDGHFIAKEEYEGGE